MIKNIPLYFVYSNKFGYKFATFLKTLKVIADEISHEKIVHGKVPKKQSVPIGYINVYNYKGDVIGTFCSEEVRWMINDYLADKVSYYSI